MIYRLLSATGAVAHIGDAMLNRIRAARMLLRPTAPILAIVALAVCAMTGAFALQAGDRTMHVYDAAQLAADKDAGPGYLVQVTGYLSDEYTRFHDFDGSTTFYDYFLLDSEGSPKSAIVVRSTKAPGRMLDLYWGDNKRQVTGTLREPVSIQVSVKNAKLGDVKVVTRYVLSDGDTPPPATPLFALSVIFGLFGLLSVAGWLSGYVVFRRGRAGTGAQPMGALWVPAHVTGVVAVPNSVTRAREMSAYVLASATGEGPEALRSAVRPEYLPTYGGSPLPYAAGSPSRPHLADTDRPVFLTWTDRATFSMRLTPSKVREAVPGTAYPFGGARAAIRIRGGRGQLLLSFVDAAARDSVFHQMRTSGGLIEMPDGRLVPAEPASPEPQAVPPDAIAPEPAAQTAPAAESTPPDAT